MPRESFRSQRVSDQIQRDLASILRFEVQDPRLNLVTVNSVKVSANLAYADIYVTCMSFDHQLNHPTSDEILPVLNQAVAYFRSKLGRMLRLRRVPELRFHYDKSLDTGCYLTSLINQVRAEDLLVEPELLKHKTS
ncbi:MAG: 30S ribosome-binding factor RbfA [Endozoicomonadaceae bacterium]|nr:30S ribosome-binding factor RbfA [Endozoicomonadaceae bacterium]MBE8232637.1 30S ribosome-binding factor RbfA [Endozoicomonadaceae bacterium]